MKRKLKITRLVGLAIIFAALLFIFIYFIIQIQIVSVEHYKNEANKQRTRIVTEPALRGEITDSLGNVLVKNRIGHNIVLDKGYIDNNDLNQVILNLTKILEKENTLWNDNLPITKSEPFEFIDDGSDYTKNLIARLKKDLEVQQYATVDNVMNALIKFYNVLPVDKNDKPLKNYTPKEIRTIVGVRREMVLSDFSLSKLFVFAEDIPIEMAIKIQENLDLTGVSTIEVPFREYVSGKMAPHIIGQVGPIFPEELEDYKSLGYEMDDIVGRSGIERAMEDYLKGKNGKRQDFLDASGRIVNPSLSKRLEDVVPGQTIKLTIDSEMQKIAQDELQRQIYVLRNTALEGKGRESDAGALIALEVKTGKILAAANFPNYDIMDYQTNYQSLLIAEKEPLNNRAIHGLYAPGSCYKPVVAIAGLSSGTITPTSHYYCAMVFEYKGYSPTCLSYHGDINVLNALQKSCNIFFYNAGLDLGIYKMNEFAELFGLAQPTGVEISERNIGQLASPELRESKKLPWYPGDVLQAAIGQSDHMFTPLQMANYTATLARDGVLLESHLVDQIISYNGDKIIKDYEVKEVSRIPNTNDAFKTVREGMVMASRYGGTSAMVFGDYPYDVASKTGTPETNDYPNSVYIAYAPAEDPQIAVVVIIEKGWHGYTGAPVAKSIFDYYFFKTKNDVPPPEIDFTETNLVTP